MSTKTLAESRFRYSLAPITLPDAKPGSCRGVFHSEGLDPFALSISVGQEMTPGAEYVFAFAMLDEDGEPVTVTQTARYVSE